MKETSNFPPASPKNVDYEQPSDHLMSSFLLRRELSRLKYVDKDRHERNKGAAKTTRSLGPMPLHRNVMPEWKQTYFYAKAESGLLVLSSPP